jgi:flagellar biosynthetic protein FliR
MADSVLALNLYAYLLVFARLGTALMLFPGFGETQVAPRIRLSIALGVSLVVLPIVAPGLPAVPVNPLELGLVLLGEIFVGFFLGTIVRMMMAAIQIAGAIIATETGLANALVPELGQGGQAAIATNFLLTLALVLIFAADLHHVMFRAIIDSYSNFPPGRLPPIEDFSEAISRVLAKAFLVGFQMAAPLVIMGILLSLGMGVLSKLMPQIQVFFIVVPLQISLGMLIFAAALGTIMGWFVQSMGDVLMGAIGQG